MQENKQAKGNFIIALSISLIFISSYLFATKELTTNIAISNLNFESVDIKSMSTVQVAYKDGFTIKDNKQDTYIKESYNIVKALSKKEDSSSIQQLPAQEIKWRLPTKTGRITTYPNYYHVAFDITSPNGIYETIYPVANGTITGIYNDSAGAKIITIHHNIDDVNYTSQYVHLSSYANELYVGKYVTVNDPIGQMGATGIATGVHLHITVVDNCILFDPNDSNCRDLNSFFKYIKLRHNQGFTGLNNLINVPNSW